MPAPAHEVLVRETAPNGLPHRSSPGATLKDVSAAVSQRAAQWAETRAPFARWTAAHYARPLGVAIDAPQLGEALEPLYEEYVTVWKSNFRRPTPSTRRCP